MNGIELIAKERERQIKEEGFLPSLDDSYTKGELCSAAVSYILFNYIWGWDQYQNWWPVTWNKSWFKPKKYTIENLTKSGALIAAEIDRILRSEQYKGNH